MRHGGQRSRRFMRRLMERMAQKRLIAAGREAERREIERGKRDGQGRDRGHA